MWVTGCHVPYGKISIKLLKNKKKLLPWDVMPLNDKELHLSITSGQENNGFLLLFEPLFSLEEASSPFSGSFL